MTLFMSSLMRLTNEGFNLAGPTRPYQVVASKPANPCSSMVGTLGCPFARLVRVCASAIALPLLTCGVADVIVSKQYCT